MKNTVLPSSIIFGHPFHSRTSCFHLWSDWLLLTSHPNFWMLQFSRNFSGFSVFHFESSPLLLSFRNQRIQTSSLPLPIDRIPKSFTTFVVFKFCLTKWLVVVIVIKAFHGNFIFSPTGILRSCHLTGFLSCSNIMWHLEAVKLCLFST